MPFVSDKQRKYLWFQKPDVARKFAKHELAEFFGLSEATADGPDVDAISWDEAEQTWPECSVAWDRDRYGKAVRQIVPVGGMLYAEEDPSGWNRYVDDGTKTFWKIWRKDDVGLLCRALAGRDGGVRVRPGSQGWIMLETARSSSRDVIRISESNRSMRAISSFLLKIDGLQLQASTTGPAGDLSSYSGESGPIIIRDVVRALSDRGDLGRSEWGQDNFEEL